MTNSKALSSPFFCFVFGYYFFFRLLVIISLQKLRMLTAATLGAQSTVILPQLRGGENKAHTALYRAPGSTAAQAGEALHGEDRLTTGLGSSGRWGGHIGHRVQGKRSHSPTHSSDSAHSQHNLHPHREKSSHQKK